VLLTDTGQKHHIITLTLAHQLPAGDACIAERGRTRQARNPRDVTCMMLHRNSTGHSSFQASMKANLIGFGLQRRFNTFISSRRSRTSLRRRVFSFSTSSCGHRHFHSDQWRSNDDHQIVMLMLLNPLV
jgi:hypothetical protein